MQIVCKASLLIAVVTLFGCHSALAADDKQIQAAIDKGVTYLKKNQAALANPGIGNQAFAALTLLECGTPKDDPFIQQTATTVRKSAMGDSSTYHIAICILFLDRLGEVADIPIIEALGVNLVAGQLRGLWDYNCPTTPTEEQERVHLAGEKLKKEPKSTTKRTLKDLSPAAQKQLTELPPFIRRQDSGDLSNTQFAILGVWAAHRYGVPVDASLTACDIAVRALQHNSGQFIYSAGWEPSGPMTCAGLVVLAVARGRKQEIANEGSKPAGRIVINDARIVAGLAALGTGIGLPAKKGGIIPVVGNKAEKLFYFLWSLERVGVFFDLQTIGNKDWYAWGADVLIVNQLNDGNWEGEYAQYTGINTCFALLFLKKSNFAPDLTRTLRGGGISDPGTAVLKVDPGTGSEKPSPPLSSAKQLADELAKTSIQETPTILAKFKEAQGASYTLALAEAIVQLDAPKRKLARELLAERLAGLSSKTINDWLLYDNNEIKQAAALACAMKEDRQMIPSLIPLLLDADKRVATVTHVALKSLSGQDFGPKDANAALNERELATKNWQKWWQEQSGK